MEKYQDRRYDTQSGKDNERTSLSVVDMIGLLTAIEQNLADDRCLMDLAPEISAVRDELVERRKIAIQIAAEIDAENYPLLN